MEGVLKFLQLEGLNHTVATHKNQQLILHQILRYTREILNRSSFCLLNTYSRLLLAGNH